MSRCEELVDAMEAGGVNCIDLYTPDPELRSQSGPGAAGPAGEVCPAGPSVHHLEGRPVQAHPGDLAEVKEGFADQLRRLETDHVEIGMIHYVDSLADWEAVRTGGGDGLRPGAEGAGSHRAASASPATIRRWLWRR